jgi:hypothetical protein
MTAAGPRSGLPSDKLVRLLTALQASGFEDLRGAEVSATVPVSERLLNELIQESLQRSVPIRDLHVSPREADRFGVRARLGSSSLLPPLTLSVLIDRQPDLPSSAVLVLKLEIGALMSLAAPLLRFLDALPHGIRLDRDRVYVDLAALLEQRGLGHYLRFVRRLEVHTIAGAVVATVHATVR